jgi:hypothetical protein
VRFYELPITPEMILAVCNPSPHGGEVRRGAFGPSPEHSEGGNGSK